MKHLFVSATALLAAVASFVSVSSGSKTLPWRTLHYENVLGTSMELKLSTATQADADRAERAAIAEIQRLNGILSGYDKTSEFSRWSATRGEAVRVSPELMEVLHLWDDWSTRTGGALSPSAEAIARVWKNAEASGHMPARTDLGAAVSTARQPQWRLQPALGLATRLNDTPLMLNSFTKSYIVERAAQAALRTPGVSAVVVNIGGDLVVRGASAEAVDVADPRSDAENSDPVAVLNVRDRSVATSGSYRRGFDIAGVHYSHIVDPRTGNTADQIIGATVVAPKAVDAGALATAFCVLSPEESCQLARKVDGVEYMVVRNDGVRFVSAGWNGLQAPRIRTAAFAAPQVRAAALPDSGQWNPGYELAINIEVPQTQGFGARRPYLAVWIEDKDRFPVRTLGLWFNNMRWLNELRAWYRDDRLRAMSEGTEILKSVTSATRSPGKYTFKWDGKDNTGKLVKAGRYTVLVEAAREHGGYSLLRREMNFNGEPSQAQLPQDAEVGPVSIDYRKAVR